MNHPGHPKPAEMVEQPVVLRPPRRLRLGTDIDELVGAVEDQHLAFARLVFLAGEQAAATHKGFHGVLLRNPSPSFRGEREGPIAERWEREVGLSARALESLTSPRPSPPPGGGEGVAPITAPRGA